MEEVKAAVNEFNFLFFDGDKCSQGTENKTVDHCSAYSIDAWANYNKKDIFTFYCGLLSQIVDKLHG